MMPHKSHSRNVCVIPSSSGEERTRVVPLKSHSRNVCV